MRNGTKGAAWDLGLYMRDFDFQLQEVQMPLKLFHGERDVNAPIALVRSMVAKLPSAACNLRRRSAFLNSLQPH
jgi:hypothetical protein